MNRTQPAVKKPTSATGLFATLRAAVRGEGTRAPMRRYLALLAVALSATLTATATPALAAKTHVFSSSFTGAPGTPLNHPWGIDVDGAANTVLVADSSNNEVAKFDLSGAPLEFSGLGSNELRGAGAPEEFGELPMVADARGGGNVYAADFTKNVVDAFTPAGVYVGQLTGAGSPAGAFSTPFALRVAASGDVWVIDFGNDVVDEFEPEEGGKKFKYLRQIEAAGLAEPLTQVSDVALDAEGNVYVAANNALAGHFQVDEFNALGEFQFVLDPTGGTSVAVDTSTIPNTVYALEDGGKHIASFQSTSFSGVPLAVFGSPGEKELQDIGVDSTTHTVYATDYNDGVVDVFAEGEPLQAPTTEAASEVLASSANLHGTLNPAATKLKYLFEYSEGTQASCTGTGTRTSEEEGEGAVSASVAGLLPNQTYTFCVIAKNGSEEATGAALTFTTGAVKPTVERESEQATNITATSADLTAKIDPEGASTSYQVEYDTSPYTEGEPAHGTSVPGAAPLTGRSPVAISVPLTELKAGRTYYWRLSAMNAGGPFVGPGHSFIYPATAEPLPDNRKYELVTPNDKNGAVISGQFDSTGGDIPPSIAADGQSMIAVSIQCFDAAESCTADRGNEGEPYEFARTPAGWVTRPLAPSDARFEANSNWGVNATDHTMLLSAPPSPGAPDTWYTKGATGLTAMGPVSEGPFEPNNFGGVSLSADVTHLVFGGKRLWTFDGELEEEEGLYEYHGAGSKRPLLVGVSEPPGSTEPELISRCGTELGGGFPIASLFNSISSDGRTVFFKADGGASCVGRGPVNGEQPVPHGELFARVDGESGEAHTIALSEPHALTPGARPECGSPACVMNTERPAGHTVNPNWRPAVFSGASSDGTRMFFTSEQQLTDQAGQGEGKNLYESLCTAHCQEAGEQRELLDLSELQGGGAVPGGPRVQGVLALAPDGSHVYFVAQSRLTGTEENQDHQRAIEGGDNLYVAAEGQPVRFIGTLQASGAASWGEGSLAGANVTPDGRFLVFESQAALTADDTRPGGPAQIYRYDAGTNALVRVSIGHDGFGDNGNSGSAPATIALAENTIGPSARIANPTMSNDGEYVFFESPNQLTAGALNDIPTGEERLGFGKVLAENVYEYHNGNVYLISDGRDLTTPRLQRALIGTDSSGANVFFSTNDQLVPEDTNTQLDYYDAHICSESEPCPPYKSPPPAPCSEEECHPAAAGAGSGAAPASESFTGPGNLTPGVAGSPAAKPKTAAQLRAAKLAAALKVCRRKHARAKRVACEKQAHRAYGATAKAKKAKRSRRASSDRRAAR